MHFWVVAGEASLLSMAVVPEMRRLGLGRSLLTQLRQLLRQASCAEVHLEVRVGNIAAQSLYRNFGFRPNGRRTGYYADTGEDALLMWLRLDTEGPTE